MDKTLGSAVLSLYMRSSPGAQSTKTLTQHTRRPPKGCSERRCWWEGDQQWKETNPKFLKFSKFSGHRLTYKDQHIPWEKPGNKLSCGVNRENHKPLQKGMKGHVRNCKDLQCSQVERIYIVFMATQYRKNSADSAYSLKTSIWHYSWIYREKFWNSYRNRRDAEWTK